MNLSTRIISVAEDNPRTVDLVEAAQCLRSGGLVVFPTETVYGLGANALSSDAVSLIFRVKRRPADNPVIVHVSDREMVNQVALSIPDVAEALMDNFWPGPLTLVMQKRTDVPDVVTAGLNSISVRMPAHQVALALISESGVPVAAPSANISGRASITSAAEAVKELSGMVDFIIDSGRTRIGIESTVLDIRRTPPAILRPGGVTLEQLREAIGDVMVHPAAANKNYASHEELPSPGMKYTHYAPQQAILILVEYGPRTGEIINRLCAEYRTARKKVGLMITDECEATGDITLRMGSRSNVEGMAKRLYSAIRELDESGVDVIIAEGIPETDIGLAVMNRLRRAASRIEQQA